MTMESSGQELSISNFLLDFTLLLRNMVQHVKKTTTTTKKNTLISLERFFAMFLLISLLTKTSLKRQYFKKCIENSVETMHTEDRV